MTGIPPQVRDFLSKMVVGERPMAYLRSDRSGRLRESGGQLEAFGVKQLTCDHPLDQQVFFLAGLLPVSEHGVSYTCVEIDEAVLMEIHLFREADSDWTLLLGASDETQLRRTLVEVLRMRRHPTASTE